MVAFIFDSGKFNTFSYGKARIGVLIKGKELQKNPYKIVALVGDNWMSLSDFALNSCPFSRTTKPLYFNPFDLCFAHNLHELIYPQGFRHRPVMDC